MCSEHARCPTAHVTSSRKACSIAHGETLNNIHVFCLVLSSKHVHDPDQHLCRGGVPICFPNVGPHLSLPTDGFLQDCHWSVAETAQSPPLGVDRAPQVTLMAESDESTLQIWPHRFYAAYTVSPTCHHACQSLC